MLRAIFLCIITLGISIAATLAVPRFALAQCDFGNDHYAIKSFACYAGLVEPGGTAPSPGLVIGNVIRLLLLLTSVIFFLFFFWAGLKWMTARGNAEIVEESRKIMENLGLGLAVILISYAFTTFVMNQFFK